MNSESNTGDDRALVQAFQDVRSWVDERLMARGIYDALPKTRGEDSAVTRLDIDRLKHDISTLITLEGRRSFWSGLWINTAFFVLGLLGGWVFDAVRNVLQLTRM
jgi:hypothetical protein